MLLSGASGDGPLSSQCTVSREGTPLGSPLRKKLSDCEEELAKKVDKKQRSEKAAFNHVEQDLFADVRKRSLENDDSRNPMWTALALAIFGISSTAAKSRPASKLIYPYSLFALVWLWLTCMFLLYTAVVTPATISFHWLDAECDSVPTLYFDCVLDAFFLCDIFYSFSLGVIFRGKYYDDRMWVAKHYIMGSFAFDILTSIPVSFVELTVANACAGGNNPAAGIDSSQLRFIRAMKPLKWFKLARIFKLQQASNVMSMVCDFFGFEPRHQRLSLLGLRVLGLIHLGGCIVWLVKVLTTSEASVDSFLNDFADHEGEFVDLSTLSGKLSAYCVCTYFVTTIFSTVGFGDISANSR